MSERVDNWKRKVGRSLTAKIIPADLGRRAANDASYSCSYRFWLDGNRGNWREGTLIPAQGGTQLVIRGVPDEDALIEVRVQHGNSVEWRSYATSQYVTVEMSKPGDGT